MQDEQSKKHVYQKRTKIYVDEFVKMIIRRGYSKEDALALVDISYQQNKFLNKE